MMKQCLNGVWEYRVGKGEWGTMQVPYSRFDVGHSEIRRTFDLENKGKTVLLQFEGITYYAKVYLNGEYLGEMLAYSEYRFDISDKVKKKGNVLLVELEDISYPFGASEGWENFGGIIRNVDLLYYNEYRLTDVFFHCALKNDYRDADCTVEITALAAPGCHYEVSILDKEKTILSYTQPFGEADAVHTASGVELWSPDSPKLYQLRVDLCSGRKVLDTYWCEIGFREFTCDRHRFLLNGQPIFLHGVCKHEMIGDSGHCPTVEQIENDLLMIKNTGCNFVRLVHYPHRKETLEIADRLGLMVSEEPGLWWADTANPLIANGSKEVLRRVILRDRNHASIVFWLCFNECVFTEQYLVESAKLCKETDPTRLVSGANCMSNEDTLKYYNICGFDFYTMHPYAQTFAERAAVSVSMLYDKPLMFTEWGGRYLYDNPKLLGEFIEEMIRLYRVGQDGEALAGASFWFWAELYDFNRHAPACHDGLLSEGLVTIDRKPTLIYDIFCKAWKELDNPKHPTGYCEPQEAEVNGTPFKGVSGKHTKEELIAATQIPGPSHMAWKRVRAEVPFGPVLPRELLEGVACEPWMLSDGDSAVFEGNAVGTKVHILGAVSLGKGYPVLGEYGEIGANVTVTFADGSEKVFPLRNGVEFTSAYTTLASSRINPIAEKAKAHTRFGYDRNFENYLLNRLDLDLGGEKRVCRVTFASADNDYHILVYGVTVG